MRKVLSMPTHMDQVLNSQLLESSGTPAKAPTFRICFCSDFFHPNVGGVESHMYKVAQSLMARGHKVVVITSNYGNERIGVRHLSNGLKVYHLPTSDLFRQCSLPDIVSMHIPILRKIFIREQIEIVNTHQSASFLVVSALHTA